MKLKPEKQQYNEIQHASWFCYLLAYISKTNAAAKLNELLTKQNWMELNSHIHTVHM